MAIQFGAEVRMKKLRVFALSISAAALLAICALAQTPAPPATTAPVIRYVPGSTIKVQQLLGEEDKERHQPTLPLL
jgi:hypothetical protein